LPSDEGSPGSSSRERRRPPVFVMSFSEQSDEWTLIQSRCDYCAQRPRHLTCAYLGKGQQVAHIRHSRRTVAQRFSVHHASVRVPPLLLSADAGGGGGKSAVWCPLWTGKDLAARSQPKALQPSTTDGCTPRCADGASSEASSPCCRSCTSPTSSARISSQLLRLLPGEDEEALEIESVLPTWDAEVESLVLNFAGRTATSSPRNFKVSAVGSREEVSVLLQHAKISNNMWCLDFRHPLSTVQAFGIAMSSIRWD
jgi:hypothetical protein